jgi:c-di-GMP-binding flagellar brake protein YcgR
VLGRDVLLVFERPEDRLGVVDGETFYVVAAASRDARYRFLARALGWGPDGLSLWARLGDGERVQSRDYVREAVDLPALVVIDDAASRRAPTPHPMRVVNLSGGGFRAEMDRPLHGGTRYRVLLQLPGTDQPVTAVWLPNRVERREAVGKVVWVASGPFVDVAESDRERVVRFVLQAQRQRLRWSREP